MVWKLWLGMWGGLGWAQIQLQAPNQILDSSHNLDTVCPDLGAGHMSKTQPLNEFAAYLEIKQVYP